MRTPTRNNSLAVALALALGLALSPTASSAAGSLMTLVDSDSATQAQVDTGGKLRVGDGFGAMTVNGTVSTRALQPTKAWSSTGSGSSAQTIRAFVVGTVLTQLNVANNDTSAAQAYIAVYHPNGYYSLLYFTVPAKGTVSLPFPQGYTIAKANSSVKLGSSGGISLFFMATGYDL